LRSGSELEPLVDSERLGAYLRTRMPDLEPAELEVERHMAGHSNETFFVRSGGREFVLRRPPRGAFLPTAHDVEREFRVLSALAGKGVRAPRPLFLCEDAGVIGGPFYLMERVAGVVIRDRLPKGLEGADARKRLGEELVDALVELHAVNWRAAGLEGFGKPSGYLERQVRRWKGQLELTEPLTRPVLELHRVRDWLERHVPDAGDQTVVHGDYKLDNVAFDLGDGPPRLTAILDWEMSTLGDPLADVGWMLSFWREPGDPAEFVMDEQTVTRQPGFASREELLDRYRERSGREVPDLSFYLVLAVWKLAILLEGSYARHLAGMTDDPFFAYMEEGVPALARRALALTAS
jgi:aminoglycoside phosphotransferase (APT) family kinase protein